MAVLPAPGPQALHLSLCSLLGRPWERALKWLAQARISTSWFRSSPSSPGPAVTVPSMSFSSPAPRLQNEVEAIWSPLVTTELTGAPSSWLPLLQAPSARAPGAGRDQAPGIPQVEGQGLWHCPPRSPGREKGVPSLTTHPRPGEKRVPMTVHEAGGWVALAPELRRRSLRVAPASPS